MDIARNLFDHHGSRPSGRGPWWSIKYHCRSLRVDRRHLVHNQSLIWQLSGVQHSCQICTPDRFFNYSLSITLDRKKEGFVACFTRPLIILTMVVQLLWPDTFSRPPALEWIHWRACCFYCRPDLFEFHGVGIITTLYLRNTIMYQNKIWRP